MKIYTCPICLEVVRPDPVLCVNEHIVCRECKAELTECPTCRQTFSDEKPSRFISQAIEVFPKTCRHENCEVFVKPGDDHEQFCGLKKTTCKICLQVMPGKDIIDHVKEKHQDKERTNSKELKQKKYDFDKPNLYFLVFIVSGYFIWLKGENNPNDKKYYQTCYLVPNGKPKHKIYFKIVFSSDESEFIRRIKLNPDPDVDSRDENTIEVPWTSLPDYVDSDKTLTFNVIFTTEKI